jgi:hypothetical protein
VTDRSPLAPFADWPVQLEDPALGFAWYTEPATFVNQLLVERATADTANRLHDVIDHVIEREREDIEAHGGLLIIHDWRELAKYDSDARKAFLDRMRGREPGYLRGAVAVVRNTPLLRMAVQTANLVMALRAGGDLEMTTAVGPALTKHGVAVPTRRGWA